MAESCLISEKTTENSAGHKKILFCYVYNKKTLFLYSKFFK